MKILIVKLSSIGDLTHTLPAVSEIRRMLPQAHLAWAVERRAAAVIKDCQAIDELIELDTRAWRQKPLARSTIRDLRARLEELRGGQSRFDVAIDFQGLIKSGVVCLASAARRRIGFETGELREKTSRLFLTEQVSTARFKHVIDKNLALARAAALTATSDEQTINDAASYEFPIHVPPEDERYVDEITEARARRFAIINPGGGWATKLWSPRRYAEIIDWLWRERELVSLITYGPGEESLAQSIAAISQSGAAHPIASTLKQFVALARRADLFIGGDTGPLHIAAACGTPIVGLYGPTSPERNGPFDRLDETVSRDLWCRTDCHRRTCWHWQCMDISVDAVKRAVSNRLDRNGKGAIVIDEASATDEAKAGAQRDVLTQISRS